MTYNISSFYLTFEEYAKALFVARNTHLKTNLKRVDENLPNLLSQLKYLSQIKYFEIDYLQSLSYFYKTKKNLKTKK